MSEQPDHHHWFQAVYEWLERCCTQGVRDPAEPDGDLLGAFVPQQQLKQFLSRHRVKQLLRTLFHHDSPDADHIVKEYQTVFCILIVIGQAHMIQHCVLYPELSDKKLPFEDRPTNFPRSRGTENANGDNIWKNFQKHQRRFCSPIFQPDHIGVKYPEDTIFPYTKRDKRAGEEGSGAEIFEVKIHPEFDTLRGSGFQEAGEAASHTYALKVYSGPKAEQWGRAEVDAFQKLKTGGGRGYLIGFYGSYIFQQRYHLILEFANVGTLDDYFSQFDEPRDGEDIVDFWSGLLKVLDPLIDIHDRKDRDEPSDSSIPRIFKGCHQDVKPSNILVQQIPDCSEYKCTFKLSDLGTTHFRLRNSPGPLKNGYGTSIYGAPENYRPDDFEDHRLIPGEPSADIWSFGCVLSEAAAWVVNGKAKGLDKYREKRARFRPDSFRGSKECFHDGTELIKAVKDEHRRLVKQKRESDPITQAIVSLLGGDVLIPDPGTRLTAPQLRRKMNQIIEDARKELAEERQERPVQVRAVTTPTDPASEIRRSLSMNIPPTPPRQTSKTDGRQWREYQQKSVSGTSYTASPVSISQQEGIDVVPEDPSASVAEPSSESPLVLETDSRTPENRSIKPNEGHHRHSSEAQGDAPPLSSPSQRLSGPANAGKEPSDPAQRRGPPAHMSYSDVKEWYDKMKEGQKTAKLPHDELTKGLKGRDHVFVVDDSETMRDNIFAKFDPGIPNVKDLLHMLAYVAKQYDPDGVELQSLNGRVSLPKATKQAKAVRDALSLHQFHGMSDLTLFFDDLFGNYIARIDEWIVSSRSRRKRFLRIPKPPRPVTYYIITDGVWQRGDSFGQDAIVRLVGKLSEAGLPRSHVGLQFISYGSDPAGLKRLAELDCLNITKKLKLDIVDTVRFDGNVWKMLLGAINENFDSDQYCPAANTTENGPGISQ